MSSGDASVTLNSGKKRGRKREGGTTTEREEGEACARAMWEVPHGFCGHEPFESFVNAAQFNDSSHRHRTSTLSVPRLVTFPPPPPPLSLVAMRVLFIRWVQSRLFPPQESLPSFSFPYAENRGGVKFVINCQVSGAG